MVEYGPNTPKHSPKAVFFHVFLGASLGVKDSKVQLKVRDSSFGMEGFACSKLSDWGTGFEHKPVPLVGICGLGFRV